VRAGIADTNVENDWRANDFGHAIYGWIVAEGHPNSRTPPIWLAFADADERRLVDACAERLNIEPELSELPRRRPHFRGMNKRHEAIVIIPNGHWRHDMSGELLPGAAQNLLFISTARRNEVVSGLGACGLTLVRDYPEWRTLPSAEDVVS